MVIVDIGLGEGMKKILVVDDDRSILLSFTRILERNGYEIETAETGKEALGKAKNQQYDLVLLDLRLPDILGTDLLVKAKKKFQKTAVIMITGFPSLKSGVKALEMGVDAYLTKPVQPMELLSVIEDKL